MSVNDGKISTCRSLPVPTPEVSRAEVSGRGDMSEGGGWVLCARLEPRVGGVEGRGGGAVVTGLQKHLCHLQSPARVRNVRPPRAHIVFWMRPLYF